MLSMDGRMEGRKRSRWITLYGHAYALLLMLVLDTDFVLSTNHFLLGIHFLLGTI